MRGFIEMSDFGHTVDFLFMQGPRQPQAGDTVYITKPVQLEFKALNDGERWEPTLRIDGGREFLQSLRDALDDLGIPSNRHAKVEGLLEATKAHLEDIRTLALADNHK